MLWILFVLVQFALTRDNAAIHSVVRSLTKRSHLGSNLFLLSQFILIPIGLWVVIREIFSQLSSRALRGGTAGLIIAMWASTSYLCVPYLGAYFSLPSAGYVMLFEGLTGPSSPQASTIVIGNFVVYTALGALLAMLRPKKQIAGTCRKCAYDLTGNVSGTCPECGSPISNDKTPGAAE